MLIPSLASVLHPAVASLSRRVNANFECWNAWVDLADLAVMAAAGMALARLAAEVAARIAALIVVPIASAVKNMATAVSDCLSADVPAQVVAGMENIAVAPLYAPAPSLPFHWRMARAENQDDESCMSYP